MACEMNTVSFEKDSTSLFRLDVLVVSLNLSHTSVDITLHI
jgi:hypothetical protein